MKTTRITASLTQLTRFGLINAYLVREDDGLTLVDTTIARSGDAILAAARAAGAPIRRIALTHGHGDHVGALDELVTSLGAGEVQVLMPELDARIHAGETVTDRKPTGSWPNLETTPDVRLHAGDRIGSLEVVASPGHTPGHVALLDTRDRSLLAGDVYSSVGGLAVASKPYWRFPLPGFVTFDKPENLRSARALRELEPSRLALGHGPVVESPLPAMDAAIGRVSG